MKYFVSDVCETLVTENTTTGLLRWHLSRTSRLRRLILDVMTSRYSPVRFAIVLCEHLVEHNLMAHVQVLLLRGDSYEQLCISAREYASMLLAKKRVVPVFDCLAAAISKHQLVLASASLEPVVRELASRLGAEYIASTLEVVHGRLTGHYLDDVTGEKVDALDKKLGNAWRKTGYHAVSDNVTDLMLLKGADEAFVVVRDQADQDKWRDIRATFILAR